MSVPWIPRITTQYCSNCVPYCTAHNVVMHPSRMTLLALLLPPYPKLPSVKDNMTATSAVSHTHIVQRASRVVTSLLTTSDFFKKHSVLQKASLNCPSQAPPALSQRSARALLLRCELNHVHPILCCSILCTICPIGNSALVLHGFGGHLLTCDAIRERTGKSQSLRHTSRALKYTSCFLSVQARLPASQHCIEAGHIHATKPYQSHCMMHRAGLVQLDVVILYCTVKWVL